MNKIGLLIKMTKPEKHNLQKIATRFGYNLSEYIKRKLFNENIDIEAQEIRYFSPSSDKHNLLNVSILYKSFPDYVASSASFRSRLGIGKVRKDTNANLLIISLNTNLRLKRY